jgi:hypothetical protein
MIDGDRLEALTLALKVPPTNDMTDEGIITGAQKFLEFLVPPMKQASPPAAE